MDYLDFVSLLVSMLPQKIRHTWHQPCRLHLAQSWPIILWPAAGASAVSKMGSGSGCPHFITLIRATAWDLAKFLLWSQYQNKGEFVSQAFFPHSRKRCRCKWSYSNDSEEPVKGQQQSDRSAIAAWVNILQFYYGSSSP